MKRLVLPLLASLIGLAAAANPQPAGNDSVVGRKKVALVLSGGGALGASHVGALKVIEETGIPIDMVLGTSIGSIVGAMYSVGYNSDDLATMFRTMDWAELFLDRQNSRHSTLEEREASSTYLYEREFYVRHGVDPRPGGVIRGNNIETVFGNYLQDYPDSINFLKDLPRQFACVATDLVSDKEVLLTSGSLVKSIRASMSIPGVFTPVHLDSMVLVDGGTKNNFPADEARNLGADVVIGIKFDLGLGTDKRYSTLMDVLERSMGSDITQRTKDNEKYCDLIITVPVRGFSSGSFMPGAVNTLIKRGEEAAREKFDSLMNLKASIGVNPDVNYSIHLRRVDNLKPVDTDKKGLVNTHEGNTILASLGLRYDNEDLMAALLNARYFIGQKANKELSLTLRLGVRSMLRMAFDFEPRPWKSMGVSYEFWHNLHNGIYHKAHRTDDLQFIYQHANAKLFSFNALNFDFELGMGWEHYHFFKGIKDDQSDNFFKKNEHYFNYHARMRYSNENRQYFTTRGVRAEARYAYYTDNFIQWKDHAGFSALTAIFRGTIPITRTTHLRPTVEGRLLFGDDVPATKHNAVGGANYGKYFPHQLPMTGMGHVEFLDSKYASASLRLQQRIVQQHYLLVDGTVAEHSEEMSELFDRTPIWGIRAAYFYNSFLGPLGLSVGWNSYTNHVNVLVSLGYDF